MYKLISMSAPAAPLWEVRYSPEHNVIENVRILALALVEIKWPNEAEHCRVIRPLRFSKYGPVTGENPMTESEQLFLNELGEPAEPLILGYSLRELTDEEARHEFSGGIRTMRRNYVAFPYGQYGTAAND